MSEFKFLQNKVNGKWVISAPRRAHRTNVEKKTDFCPFCAGNEVAEEEVYRINKSEYQNPKSEINSNDQNTKRFENLDLEKSDIVSSFDIRASDLDKSADWAIRVITNKFPFAPNHEVIIHSTDHHKNWDELPFSQVELILQTYRQRFNFHKNPSAGSGQGGQVYIFHNRGHQAGESLPHPHTQLVVLPQNVRLDITPLNPEIYKSESAHSTSSGQGIRNKESGRPKTIIHNSLFMIQSGGEQNYPVNLLETDHFLIFCPETSEWPDEVWVAPKQNGGGFGFIKDAEITDMAFVLSRIIQIFDLRHGHEFPFNFYIAPLKNWYLRLIPRIKILGGFELGTNIIVNTGDPKETFEFIREHFWQPDHAKIKLAHQAKYRKGV